MNTILKESMELTGIQEMNPVYIIKQRGFMKRVYVILPLFFIIMLTSLCNTSRVVNTGSPAYPPGYYEDDPLPDKTVYLTFDDGPSEWTNAILDVLKEEKIKATFFICGDWAPHSTRKDNDFRKYRNTLVRMIKEGHAVGNHTVDHRDLAKLRPGQIAAELDANQELLDRELGKDSIKMTLVRPPFGSPWDEKYSEAVFTKVGNEIRSRGIIIMWSRHFDSGDSMNWVNGDWYKEAKRVNINNTDFKNRMWFIYERIISRANGKGMVILMHDTHLTTMEVLKSVVDKLKSEGYKFATAEDLVRWKWKKSSSELVKMNKNDPIE